MTDNKIPTSFTPFVGREMELSRIAELLSKPDCRLLTLVGPGGIGKTRLALQVAQLLNFPDGVYFVLFQALTSPDLIISSIAAALSFQFYEGGTPQEQLLSYLDNKSLLLVLDNFEQLLDGAELLSTIVSQTSAVRLLVTSRERLNLVEEWVLELDGLHFPLNDAEREIEPYSAVQLFVQQVRRINVNFTLTDERKPAVARICRLVGGMPLALELAAAWVRALSCEAIADEIEQSLGILQTSARNVTPRHRSMRAAFEPTWSRLTEDERAVFKKLSIFRGSFTREAAQQVASASLYTLSALVDKSLLRVNVNGRYDIQELLRQFSEEYLQRSEEIDTARTIHSLYFLEFMRQREADIKGQRQLGALNEITEDLENVRAAWYWAIECKCFDEIGQALESMLWFMAKRSHYIEGEALFRYARDHLAPSLGLKPHPIWGRLLACRIRMQMLHDGACAHDEDVKAELRYSLAIAQEHYNPADIAFSLWVSGALANHGGDFAPAVSYHEKDISLYRDLNDSFYLAETLRCLGHGYAHLGQSEKSQSKFREGIALQRKIGDKIGLAWSLNNSWAGLFRAEKYDEVQACVEEAYTLSSTLEDKVGAAINAYELGSLRFLSGNLAQTQTLAEEALQIAEEIQHPERKGEALQLLGFIASLQEDYAKGKQLLETSLSLLRYPYDLECSEWGICLALCGEGHYQAARQRVQPLFKAEVRHGVFVSDFNFLPILTVIMANEGHEARAVELLSLAVHQHPMRVGWMSKWALLERLRADLEASLGAEAFAAAWDRGKNLDIETASKIMIGYLNQQPNVNLNSTTHQSTDILSARELEILRLVADGLSNREIAERLMLAVSTVKWYVSEMLGKLHATNRTEAVARARELKMLT